MPKASDIPDDHIQQIDANTRDLYYRVGKDVSVVSFKNKNNEWCFCCMTCRKTDQCHHTRAVRRFCGHPKKHKHVEDAA